MAETNKIGFNYDERDKDSAKWESPEDIIHYVTAGLNYLKRTDGRADKAVIYRRSAWIKNMYQAMKCLEVVE